MPGIPAEPKKRSHPKKPDSIPIYADVGLKLRGQSMHNEIPTCMPYPPSEVTSTSACAGSCARGHLSRLHWIRIGVYIYMDRASIETYGSDESNLDGHRLFHFYRIKGKPKVGPGSYL